VQPAIRSALGGGAVNEAVAVSFLAFGAFNYVFTQTLLATHPQILLVE
jgi:phospholipid/cholesterol/gamma-HCH transport system permease protein